VPTIGSHASGLLFGEHQELTGLAMTGAFFLDAR
jgi:hypothetical protein